MLDDDDGSCQQFRTEQGRISLKQFESSEVKIFDFRSKYLNEVRANPYWLKPNILDNHI